jgi:hypothetical protein
MIVSVYCAITCIELQWQKVMCPKSPRKGNALQKIKLYNSRMRKWGIFLLGMLCVAKLAARSSADRNYQNISYDMGRSYSADQLLQKQIQSVNIIRQLNQNINRRSPES